jgi:hypothetical protein
MLGEMLEPMVARNFLWMKLPFPMPVVPPRGADMNLHADNLQEISKHRDVVRA